MQQHAVLHVHGWMDMSLLKPVVTVMAHARTCNMLGSHCMRSAGTHFTCASCACELSKTALQGIASSGLVSHCLDNCCLSTSLLAISVLVVIWIPHKIHCSSAALRHIQQVPYAIVWSVDPLRFWLATSRAQLCVLSISPGNRCSPFAP